MTVYKPYFKPKQVYDDFCMKKIGTHFVCISLLAVNFAYCQNICNELQSAQRNDIVIVGAGAAGLVAAQKFHNGGVNYGHLRTKCSATYFSAHYRAIVSLM